MAGYMTILQSNVFKGTLKNGAAAAVENGTLMVMGADGKTLVLPSTADTTSKFVCLEKTELYDGIEAYTVEAQSLAKNYYFVENQFDYNDSEAYDTRTYTTETGAYLRAHPLLVGDEFIVTVPAALTVGTTYGVNTSGKIA